MLSEKIGSANIPKIEKFNERVLLTATSVCQKLQCNTCGFSMPFGNSSAKIVLIREYTNFYQFHDDGGSVLYVLLDALGVLGDIYITSITEHCMDSTISEIIGIEPKIIVTLGDLPNVAGGKLREYNKEYEIVNSVSLKEFEGGGTLFAKAKNKLWNDLVLVKKRL